MFLLISIDIQVLSDLVVRFRCCEIAAWSGAIILFLLCILAILLQTKKARGGQPTHATDGCIAKKVWKTLMSIERRRNKEKRSVRTLIVIASEAG